MPFRKKLKDRLKNVLEHYIKPGQAHKDFLTHIPSDISESEHPAAPAGTYYDFAIIVGDQIGPDGRTQGAYAIADGKSGDVNRYPLPQDPNDPRSVFIENGYVSLLKSIGLDSKVVEIPGKGWLHFRPENVRDKVKPTERQHPLQAPAKSEISDPVEVVNPDFFDDPFGPNMGGDDNNKRSAIKRTCRNGSALRTSVRMKQGSLVLRAKQLL